MTPPVDAKFKLDLKNFVKKTEKISEKVFRGTALAMFSAIIKRTPVDTGFLINDWQTEINTSSNEARDKASKTGADSTADLNSTALNANIGDEIFFTNNRKYAEAIESGHSKVKAPAGMVKVVLEEFDAHIRKQVAEHGEK